MQIWHKLNGFIFAIPFDADISVLETLCQTV